MTTATKEQLAALTAPATLPGVVRQGTPVREAPHCGPVPCHGLALHDQSFPSLDVFWLSEDEMCNVGFDDVAVDLTDATGRAHVAWAVAATVKHWPTEPDYTTATWRAYRLHKAGAGLVECVGLGPGHWWPWTHHLFADLDPDDPTTLPDGSRLVDALALRAVALHVLGGA